MKQPDQAKLLNLIEQSRQGDRAAQDALIQAVQDKVYYHCRKILRDENAALDATQDVLIVLFTSLDKLKEPAAFWGWVNGITANRCKHLLTAPHKEWQLPEDEEGNSMLDNLEDLDRQSVPEQALDDRETRRMILDLVDALPPEQRMSVLFYYYDEMSVKQIAEAMEVSEGTVKSRLNYARKAIKRGVEDYERKGVKLYSVSPILLLVYFLRMDAEATVLSPAAAAAVSGAVLSAAPAAGGTVGAAAGTTSTGAAGAAAGAAAKAGGAVSAKLTAGLVAGAFLVGSVGGAGVTSMVYKSRDYQEPEPIVEVVNAAPEWSAVFAGSSVTGLLDTDGSLWIWGKDMSNIGALDSTAFSKKIMEDVQAASFSSTCAAAIKTDGSLWTWGSNVRLMLGNGSTEDSAEPVKVLDDVARVSCGDYITAAIKTDGSLWTWGEYEHDELLGVEGKNSSSVPIPVMDSVSSVSCGGWHAAAIKTDGSLWTWGDNNCGQLGISRDIDYSSTPVKVMDGVAQVSCGAWITAALKTDGSLWMWGDNFSGEMGIGTTAYSSPPVKVMDGVVQVSCGSQSTAALKTDGTVWVWGFNRNGELGLDPSTEYSAEPVRMMDGVVEIASGWGHTVARKADGTVWSLGYNQQGQLGDGTRITPAGPVQVQFSRGTDAPAS